MALGPGTRIGAFEVVSKLGEGGMGEVYRARDTELGRDVALKILPPAFAADPERLARFEREARTLAALNHPNIAAIYGLEKSGSTPVLVMELVPGRTLEDEIRLGHPEAESASSRLRDSAIAIALQIAEALEAAHDAGIVHRDLKPANIKRRDDDVVKVLDFGLARAVESASGAAALHPSAPTMLSPTMVSPAATQQGVILGTAGYMSPEQARGRPVDKRADIWAFGAILYELLTGRRLFSGETVSEVLAAVIKDAPNLGALPADTPDALRHLLARCLERDPKLRLRDIGEARILLRQANGPPSRPPAREARKVSPLLAGLAVAGALGFAGVVAAIAWNMKPETTVPVRRFDLPAPVAGADTIAISPDGNRIAYLAEGRLFLRSLDTGETRDLRSVSPGAEGLFFSPDSRRVAFGEDSALRVMPIEGGQEFVVTKVPASGRVLDGLWRGDGTIVFLVWRDSAYRVPATGGTPQLVTAVEPGKEIDFHAVTELPDGRLVVTTHLPGQDAVRADIVDGSGKRMPIATDLDIDHVRFRSPNQLLFTRRRDNIGVWTAPLNGHRLDLTKAVSLQPDGVMFDASAEGSLLSRIPPRERRNLVWVEFGNESPTQSTRSTSSVRGAAFESSWSVLSVSPDGRRAAIALRSQANQDDLMVRDFTTGVDTRIPLPPEAAGRSGGGLLVRWSRAGRLLVGTGAIETSQIFEGPADGSSGWRSLVRGGYAVMTPDGRELIFNRDERAHYRLYRAPLRADGSVGTPQPVFADANPPNVRAFDLSPDSRLLAFTDMEPITGRLNVFIAPYPDVRERRQVIAGGTQPRFSRDNKLYFLAGSRTTGPSRAGVTAGELRVVTVTHTPLAVSAARVLMTDAPGSGAPPIMGGFDVGPDGRLLMTSPSPGKPGDEARLVLLQNWPAIVK